MTEQNKIQTSEIYLAGGCFWGLEAYFAAIGGVLNAESGYANGNSENPSYQQVCNGSGHAETVKVSYDASQIKATRKSTGLTQVTLAHYMGVSPKTVEAWEAG